MCCLFRLLFSVGLLRVIWCLFVVVMKVLISGLCRMLFGECVLKKF